METSINKNIVWRIKN